ncbi:MAG: ferredoxin family protein [Deltaproteobacteria bacterium]|nr:ferredoxin family protein [Deltaproteobacteria bacterium]
MAYVVTAYCDGCKYTDCVEVCPVEAFHEGETMVYINPETCIDCDVCVSQCPVEAIYPEDQVPGQWQSYIALNAEKSAALPTLSEKKQPLPSARTLEELKSS